VCCCLLVHPLNHVADKNKSAQRRSEREKKEGPKEVVLNVMGVGITIEVTVDKCVRDAVVLTSIVFLLVCSCGTQIG
jgi:hypothetical protein